MALRKNVESESAELSDSFVLSWEQEYSKYFSYVPTSPPRWF